jgi:hypothetical protein
MRDFFFPIQASNKFGRPERRFDHGAAAMLCLALSLATFIVVCVACIATIEPVRGNGTTHPVKFSARLASF